MLRSNRLKAQGLPLNIVIIAVIGIIVLVILVAIFNFYSVKFGKETKNITEAVCPGDVVRIGECDDPVFGKFKDVGPGYICCKAKPKQQNSEQSASGPGK